MIHTDTLKTSKPASLGSAILDLSLDKAFGRELLPARTWTETLQCFWHTLPSELQQEILQFLLNGLAAIRKPAKNQRHRLGLCRRSGTLLAWRPDEVAGRGHSVAILKCHDCGRVSTMRMDHFLGDMQGRGAYASCACGEKRNRQGLLAKATRHLSALERVSLAEELEFNVPRAVVAATYKLKGSWANYALSRIWKEWQEEVWARHGADQKRLIWAYARATSLATAAVKFNLKLSEVKVIGRWCKRDDQAKAEAREAKDAQVLAQWNGLSEEHRDELLGQLGTLRSCVKFAVELVETADAQRVELGYVAGRYPGEFTRKELASSARSWSAFRSAYDVLVQVPDATLKLLGQEQAGSTFLKFKSIAEHTFRGRQARKKRHAKTGRKAAAFTCETDRFLQRRPDWQFHPQLACTLVVCTFKGAPFPV